jgi:hypothetical protein
MPDLFHVFGNDIVASANGDLLTATSVNLSQQRILRRLFTNAGDYLWQPGYGAGLPAKIGSPFDVATIESIVQSQMFLEGSVVRDPPPDIEVASFPNGMFVDIEYTESDTNESVTLSFPVTPQGLNG